MIITPSCITFLFCCFCLICKSCMTLYHPMCYSPTGSSALDISQAIILEWIVISFSNRSCYPRDWTQVSCLVGGSLTIEPPGKKAFILRLTKLQNVLLIFFMKDGPMKSNVHLCWEVTGGLLPPCPLSVRWIFSLMGIFFLQHIIHFFQIGFLIGLFFPVATPTSSPLLSHKAELPVDHELNWPSNEWLLCL